MISPGYLWLQIRRDLKRGWRAAWNDRVVSRRILCWRNPCRALPAEPVAVHVLTGREQAIMAHWMLASWFHYTERNWQIVVHDDGTLDSGSAASLQKAFPEVRVVGRAEANQRMDAVLAELPLCARYRKEHPLALKIFDVPVFAGRERFLLLDSDVAFFKRPQEILDWVDAADRNECWFNRDVQEACNVSAAEAKDMFDIELWPRVNSGVCLLIRDALDLRLCEHLLAVSSILKGHPWRVEQSLFALCVSRFGRGGLLPETYEVSLGGNRSDGCIARHYVGAVRAHFFDEGVATLNKVLLQGRSSPQ